MPKNQSPNTDSRCSALEALQRREPGSDDERKKHVKDTYDALEGKSSQKEPSRDDLRSFAVGNPGAVNMALGMQRARTDETGGRGKGKGKDKDKGKGKGRGKKSKK